MCDNRKNKYDDEPIHFCTNCLSVKIKEIGDNTNFYACLDCGCTDIEEDDLDEWVRLYTEKYGKPFLDTEEDLEKLNGVIDLDEDDDISEDYDYELY